MKLSEDLVKAAPALHDIIAACVAADSISTASGKMILAEIENSQASDIDHHRSRRQQQDRSLSWTFQPMEDGGAVVLVEDITERRNAEARISHLARYDELTALPNRVNFRDEIERLLAAEQGRTSCRRCCSSTSTSSSRSTTRSAIPAATSCCARSPNGCARCCGPRTSWRGSAATSSWCSSRTSIPPDDAAGLARRIVDRLSERYKIDNHLVEIGASIGIAMTSRGVSADHAAEERRHGAVPRQGRRPRHLLLLPGRDGAGRRIPPHPRTRPAQGAGQRGVRAVLPAAGQSQIGTDIDLRSAVALESSGSRHGFADRYHSGRRGHGPDRRSRPLDPAQGLHGMHEMARRRQRRGQLLAAAIPSARRAERSPLRARGLRPAGEPARNRDHQIARCCGTRS